MNRAQRRAAGVGPNAVDLGALKSRTAKDLVEGLTREAQEEAELRAGLRCAGCRRRLTRGYEFTRLVAFESEHGKPPEIRQQFTHACIGNGDCEYVVRAAQDSVAMRPVGWAFMDDPQVAAMLGRSGPAVVSE